MRHQVTAFLFFLTWSLSVTGQSLEFSSPDSITHWDGNLISSQLRFIYPSNVVSEQQFLGFQTRLNVNVKLEKWSFLFQPKLFLGSHGHLFRDGIAGKEQVFPSYYALNNQVGLGGNMRIQRHLGKHASIDAGFGNFRSSQGFRGLIFNGSAAPAPYFRFHWGGKRLKYTYGYQLLNNRRNRYPDDFFYSPYKGMVSHRVAYEGKKFGLAVFESILWAVKDSSNTRYIEPSYLLPFTFLRPVEFQSGSSDNVILGGSAYWQLGPTRLYGELILDEFKLKEFLEGTGWWANKFGVQIGARIEGEDSDGSKDRLIAEFNWNRPFTFTHSFPAQALTQYGFALGHPLGNNFQEILLNYQNITNKSIIGIYFSAIVEGSSNAAQGGSLFESNNVRLMDFGYSNVQQPNPYFYGEMSYSRLIPIRDKKLQLGAHVGTRLGETFLESIWVGAFLQYGIFQNNLRY